MNKTEHFWRNHERLFQEQEYVCSYLVDRFDCIRGRLGLPADHFGELVSALPRCLLKPADAGRFFGDFILVSGLCFKLSLKLPDPPAETPLRQAAAFPCEIYQGKAPPAAPRPKIASDRYAKTGCRDLAASY
ncbi:MAG: hypothetical protein LBK62_07100 [Treponema sp.]|nr:hypothetical protein [Treponema sp.]